MSSNRCLVPIMYLLFLGLLVMGYGVCVVSVDRTLCHNVHNTKNIVVYGGFKKKH
jgi:hypothetical protein